MFSGQFAGILLSIAVGAAVGFADAFGFYFTFRILALNPKVGTAKRLGSVLWEIVRMFFLAAAIVLLLRWLDLSLWAVIVSALSSSLIGKVYFILMRMKAAA